MKVSDLDGSAAYVVLFRTTLVLLDCLADVFHDRILRLDRWNYSDFLQLHFTLLLGREFIAKQDINQYKLNILVYLI